MGMPAARVSDMHMCPMITPGVPPIPHVGGPILPPCAVTVLTGGLPQARVTDMATCVGPPDVIVKGSLTVLVNDLPAGGRRFVQRVDGYKATFVAGVPIFEDGTHTGALPGRLVRAGQA